MGAAARDEIAFRRMVFSLLVIVAGCTGAWFLLTSGGGEPDARRSLTATGKAPRFTVKLLEFPKSSANQEKAAKLAQSSAVRSLASGNELHLMELSGERLALCVGRFESAEAPELRRLLEKFQEYAEHGRRPFPEAAILSSPR